MVVITPCVMPIMSCSTLTTGARQLVVHEAAVSGFGASQGQLWGQRASSLRAGDRRLHVTMRAP